MSTRGLVMAKEKTYLVCTNSNCPYVNRTTLHFRDEDGTCVCAMCGSRKQRSSSTRTRQVKCDEMAEPLDDNLI